MTNSADPDQLALKKPTDLDLHCLQKTSVHIYTDLQYTDLNFMYLRKRKYCENGFFQCFVKPNNMHCLC